MFVSVLRDMVLWGMTGQEQLFPFLWFKRTKHTVFHRGKGQVRKWCGWQVAMTTLQHERGTLGFALQAQLEISVRRLVELARDRALERVRAVGLVAAQTTPSSPNPTPRARGATTYEAREYPGEAMFRTAILAWYSAM